MAEIESVFTSNIGQVVASMLSIEQFLKINGAGWVLADGRAVPNSAYAKLVGASVPDLRGVYLRGKNYGRDTTTGNADGDLVVGTFQKNEMALHTHSTVQMIHNNEVDGVDSVTTRSYEHHNEPTKTGEWGGNETRPNTVTINWFICIN